MLQVYITDLQSYNEGDLVGNWVKLPLTKFELSQAIYDVLNEGESISESANHEEIFITDYEWDSYELQEIFEYKNLDELNDILWTLKLKSDHELKAIEFLIQNQLAINIEDAISKADDVTIHEHQNMEDLAYELMQECYQADKLPSIIANNIDYESIARELEYDGTYFESGPDVFEYIG